MVDRLKPGDWEWQLKAACRDEDPDLFYIPEGERGSARKSREKAAQVVCASCPVIFDCREHAIRMKEHYGVWGGLTEGDREGLLSLDRRSLTRDTNTEPVSSTSKLTPTPRGRTPVRILQLPIS